MIDAKSGETVYMKDLSEHLEVYNVSSPTLAGSYIYISGAHTGKTVVFKPGRTYQQVAVNQLRRVAPGNKESPEAVGAQWTGILSTPVFAGPYMYLRHTDRLYCTGGTNDSLPIAPDSQASIDMSEGADSPSVPGQKPAAPPWDLSLRWKVPIEGTCHAPIAVGNDVVIVAGNANGKDYWNAYATANGQAVWSHQYEHTRKFEFGPAPRTAPRFHGDIVFCLNASGKLHALNVRNGDVVWVKDYLSDLFAKVPTWGFSSTPFVCDDKLLINPGGGAGIMALNPASGKDIWETRTATANYANFVVRKSGDRRQLIGYDMNTLYGVNVADGKVIWKLPVENPGRYIVPEPTIIGDKLLLVDGYTGARLHEFDDHGVLKVTPVAANDYLVAELSTPFVQGDTFLLGNGYLACADAATLEILWEQEDEESFTAEVLHIVSDYQKTYVFSQDGHGFIIEANREGCKILGKAKLSEATYARPVISGNHLFARDGSFLYCYELRYPRQITARPDGS